MTGRDATEEYWSDSKLSKTSHYNYFINLHTVYFASLFFLFVSCH